MAWESHYALVNFWKLSEQTVTRVCEQPVSWHEENLSRAVAHLGTLGDPKQRCDTLNLVAAYAQILHVRLMADLTKDAPGRKLRSARSGSGKS